MVEDVPRVLIVEDEWAFRQGLLAGLSQFTSRAHVVGAVANADEALSRVEAEPTDLVLLDLRIPQYPGAERRTETGLMLIRRLKAVPARPKVLILSGHFSETLFEALMVGANGYISKDDRFEAEELIEAIERIVEGEAFYGPEVAEIIRHGLATAQSHGARPLSDRHQRV